MRTGKAVASYIEKTIVWPFYWHYYLREFHGNRGGKSRQVSPTPDSATFIDEITPKRSSRSEEDTGAKNSGPNMRTPPPRYAESATRIIFAVGVPTDLWQGIFVFNTSAARAVVPICLKAAHGFFTVSSPFGGFAMEATTYGASSKESSVRLGCVIAGSCSESGSPSHHAGVELEILAGGARRGCQGNSDKTGSVHNSEPVQRITE